MLDVVVFCVCSEDCGTAGNSLTWVQLGTKKEDVLGAVCLQTSESRTKDVFDGVAVPIVFDGFLRTSAAVFRTFFLPVAAEDTAVVSAVPFLHSSFRGPTVAHRTDASRCDAGGKLFSRFH